LGFLLDVASPVSDMAIRGVCHPDSDYRFQEQRRPMPNTTDAERLASLVARRNRTDAAIRRLKAKNDKVARANDARRKIVAISSAAK
jgi:hypothetical protein